MEQECVCPKGAWPVRGNSHLQDFAVATLALGASVSHQEGTSICTVHCSGKGRDTLEVLQLKWVYWEQ